MASLGYGTRCDVCGRALGSAAEVRTLPCLHNYCLHCRPSPAHLCRLCAHPTPPPPPNSFFPHSQAPSVTPSSMSQLPHVSSAGTLGHTALSHLPHVSSPTKGFGDPLSIDTSGPFLLGNLLDSVSLRDDSPALPHFTQGRPLLPQHGPVGNGGPHLLGRTTTPTAFAYPTARPNYPVPGAHNNGQVVARPVPTYPANNSQYQNRTPLMCSSCSQGAEGVSRCEDCQEILCANCILAHNIVRVTRDHRLVPLAQTYHHNNHQNNMGGSSGSSGLHSPLSPTQVSTAANGSCPTHKEPLWLLCETCSRPLCARCLHDHSGHSFGYLHRSNDTVLTNQLLSDAKALQKALEENSENLERMSERVEAKVTAIGNEIRATLLHHISALEERKRVLLQQMDIVRASKLTSLDWQRGELRGRLDSLRSAVGKAEGLIVPPTTTPNTSRKEPSGNVQARELLLEQLQLSRPYLGLVETDQMSFVQPDPSLLQTIKSLGEIRTPAHADKCYIIGESFRRVVRDRVAYMTMQARDAVGENINYGGDTVEVIITTPSGPCPVEVQDRENGTYLISYRPVVDGEHRVEVRVRGRPIPGTPLGVQARKGRDYTKVRAQPLLTFGGEGAEDGQLCRPWGIAINRDGHILVADRSNNRIQVFDGQGRFLYKWGVGGTRPGQLDRPAGIAINTAQEVIVCDKDNHRVQVYGMDGSFRFRFGEKGRGVGQFNYPWAVALNSQDQMAVSDTRNHRVQLFSPKGQFIKKFGFDSNMFLKHFDSPRGVAFLPDGQLLVTDFNNHRLAVISVASGEMKFYGREGDWDGTYKRPQGLDIDLEGHVVVADSRNNRVQVLTPDLRYLATVGFERTAPTPLMDRPVDIAIHPDGRIFVVDFGNNKVHAF